MNHGRRLRHLPPLRSPELTSGVPDADLLARWATHRDEAAFELLVRRHGPLVLAACRRLLSDPNDADDVFQAVFLVLARKGAAVARGEMLAAWLHRVAYRAALRVRAERGKRVTHCEPGIVEQLPAPPTADPAWAELVRVLDEEIERLPARHRIVFVLCCLEGKTGEEAGRLIGCPPGTVSSRLTRARQRLRDRLARRGFAPAAFVLAALTGDALAATVPSALVGSVLRAAPVFAARWSPTGPPARPTAIAEGVVNAMLVNKLRLIPALLVVGLLAAGAVLAGAGADRDGNPDPPRPAPKVAAGANAPPGDVRPSAAPVVRLVKPQAGGLDRMTTQRCVAEAGRQVHLYPTAAGVLARANADLGDRVKAGQLLAEIDAPGLALDERLAAVGVEQSLGLLKEAEARVVTAKADIAAAMSAVRARQAEAASAQAVIAYRKKQFDRLKELSKQGTVDQKVVDEGAEQLRAAEGLADAATAGADGAKADLIVRESKLGQAEAGVLTAKANAEAAKVGLDRARLAVVQTRIVAPFDGVVAASTAAPGQAVRAPGDRADPVPLFTVVRADVLRLVVAVPQQHAALVKAGLAAEVTFDAWPDAKATAGAVSRVGATVNPSNGAVRAEIDLPNPKGDIRPGMTGSVAIRFGKGPADAVRVPLGALVAVAPTTPGGPDTAVYVYKGGKAKLTLVRVSYQDRTDAEVSSGLTGADLVVADPKGLGAKGEVGVEVEPPPPSK